MSRVLINVVDDDNSNNNHSVKGENRIEIKAPGVNLASAR